jgi:hypothetical protein
MTSKDKEKIKDLNSIETRETELKKINKEKPIPDQGYEKNFGNIGSFSKKTFLFAIFSLSISLVGILLGYPPIIIFSVMIFGSSSINWIKIFIEILISVLVFTSGLGLGILSRKNRNKADNIESENLFVDLGCILSEFAIPLNIVPLCVTFIFLIIYI